LKQFTETLAGEAIHIGTLASGDVFVTTRNQLNGLDSIYDDIYAVDMESAAIAQVAYLKEIPFLAFRTISDLIDTEDQLDDMETQTSVAVQKGAEALRRLCDKL